TRGHRHADGRPRVLVSPEAGSVHGDALAAVLRRYAIEPVAGPSDDAMDDSGLEKLMARENPGLALVSRERSTAAKACRERGIPVVSVPEVVLSHETFDGGLSRLLRGIGADGSASQQVVAVHGGIPGVHLPGLPENAVVRWFEGRETPDLAQVDILVAPEHETTLLARAAAEGVLRVAVPAADADGGAARGIRQALGLTAEERYVSRREAYRAARVSAHPDAVANGLLRRFNEVVARDGLQRVG